MTTVNVNIAIMHTLQQFSLVKNIVKIVYFGILKYITDSNIYLDVHIRTTKQCIQHEIPRNTGFCPRNIQEWGVNIVLKLRILIK